LALKHIQKPISSFASMLCRVQMGAAKDTLTFEKEVSDGWCFRSAGSWHNIANIANIGTTPMQVYSVYAPAITSPASAAHRGGSRGRQRRRASGVASAAKTCVR